MTVVMVDVLSEDGFELTPVEDQPPVETLAADGANEALGKGVGSWGSDRCADGPDPLGAQHFVETGRELGVSVPNHELDGKRALGQHHGQISGLHWTTHASTGLTATPLTYTRRVSTSMKKST